jgi:ATP-dependent Clp protease ATP-binding subunit ClpA
MIYCIGATTRKEFSLYLSKDKAFLRRFQMIVVNEPSEADACKMICGIIKNYESFHKVTYSKNSIETAVKLSKRYIVERQLPDVALDVIDFAGSIMSINNECKNTKSSVVNSKDIESVVISLANLPSKGIYGNEMRKILSLETELKAKIMGQDKAIKQICSSIIINKSGLNCEDSNKPIASYIFYGPTGVGKTEISIQLSKIMTMNLLRIDMSEYSEAHSVSKLLGSPPGYVGFDQSGILSEEIIKNPYTVILFDEIEKSHPTIHSSLLQILDYGFITDNFGRKINFSNTIIICTTNTASKSMDKITPGFGSIENNSIIERELEEVFSPEFRNRFSAIIRFNHLEKDSIKQIIDKELSKIKSLFTKKHIEFSIDEAVLNFIIEKGYSRGMGARPIERVINDEIKIKLVDVFMQNSIDAEKVEDNANNEKIKSKKQIKRNIKICLNENEICVEV